MTIYHLLTYLAGIASGIGLVSLIDWLAWRREP